MLGRLLGEVAGVVVLVAALLFTWSDGPPADDGVDLVTPAPALPAR